MKTKWTEISANLRQTLDPGVCKVWVAPLEAEVSSDSITLSAPNAFMAGWVRSHLVREISEAAARVLGLPDVSINVVAGPRKNGPVASAKLLATAMPKQTQATLEMPAAVPGTSAPAWRFKFDDFVTGSSNNLAVAAAKDMCQSGQVRTLFITSAPGLGKTHLVQAAGQMVSEHGQPIRVAYLTAEQFASRFVAAMRAHDLESFKQYLCNLDMLLLEDIHFLQRKKAMQELVLAVIKNLQAKGSRVIFTSSFGPRQLQDMDSQLTSHFCSGIMANMEKPDSGMRREILQRKAKSYQVALPNDVCNLLSERLSSDVRQLESCLKSMIFKARLINTGLTIDLALDTMGQYAGAEACLDLNAIVRLVCESFGLTETQLRSRSRKHEYVQGRNTIFYLARKHTEMSLESIGSALSRKHSTVLRSITQVEQELARQSREGRQIARAVELIEKRCGLA